MKLEERTFGTPCISFRIKWSGIGKIWAARGHEAVGHEKLSEGTSTEGEKLNYLPFATLTVLRPQLHFKAIWTPLLSFTEPFFKKQGQNMWIFFGLKQGQTVWPFLYHSVWNSFSSLTYSLFYYLLNYHCAHVQDPCH